MKLAWIDWTIIAFYFALSLSVGLYFTRRASRSTDEYFLAGRSLNGYFVSTCTRLTTNTWLRTFWSAPF